ncbi:phosphopantetheine-binding protein [Streptomyces sp. DT2A-34]|uniref:phosphopantetheine-binding protein n=1 Tax=Streptomyces sp. DT2A-34 TaxID=3051182 RepID=UPI0034644E01
MRDIWSEVLGVPVGLEDDFLELGGNSLFAVRVGAALRARGREPRVLGQLSPLRRNSGSMSPRGPSSTERSQHQVSTGAGIVAARIARRRTMLSHHMCP